MVHLRSGKNTNMYEPRMARCGHQCCTLLFKCCACEDTRPVQATYVADNRSNLFEVSYVNRSYYYCPVCKKTPPPARSHRQPLAERPSPESSSSPTPPAEWRIHILKTLNTELQKKYESSQDTVKELRTEIKSLEAELDEMHDRLKGAVESIKYLTERIKNP